MHQASAEGLSILRGVGDNRGYKMSKTTSEVEARRAYWAAESMAEKNYQKALKQAHEDYNRALSQARKTLQNTMAEIRRNGE